MTVPSHFITLKPLQSQGVALRCFTLVPYTYIIKYDFNAAYHNKNVLMQPLVLSFLVIISL